MSINVSKAGRLDQKIDLKSYFYQSKKVYLSELMPLGGTT